MSDTVKLSGRLGKDDQTNGLDSLADALIENPEAIRFAFVWFDVSEIRQHVDTGEFVPTVTIRAIEPVGELSEVPASLQRQATKLREKRTGKTPLPFEEFDPKRHDDEASVSEISEHRGRTDVTEDVHVSGGDEE